ncbi:hypothetical protein EG329_005023 [Mollisiaceae sp. DMI_Dod_QoI]|nr:hypothetical protein EG329_005023 [Helotiales sp. DMI_Dod_QoI]
MPNPTQYNLSSTVTRATKPGTLTHGCEFYVLDSIMMLLCLWAAFVSLSYNAAVPERETRFTLKSRGIASPSWLKVAYGLADSTTSGISEELFDSFKLFANFTAAAYCPNNENSTTGTLITCSDTICSLVEADNVSAVVEFGGSNDTTLADIQGYVSLNPVKSLIVIAFAGSGSTVRDWIADFAFIMIEYTLTGCDSCWIHSGFSTGWSERRIIVLDAVTAALEDNPTYSIVITGHSIGAGVATLAATELRSMNYTLDTYTFGSPRVGNTAFATFVTNQSPFLGNNYRMTHLNDPVPQLPPTWIGYEHTSPEYLLSDGTDATDDYEPSDVIVCERLGNADCNAGTGGSLDPDDGTMKITPFRSYERIFGWEIIPADLKSQVAIVLGWYAPQMKSRSIPWTKGSPGVQFENMMGEGIALDSRQTFPGRKFLNAQRVDKFLDFAKVRQALEYCEASHGSRCQRDWPAKMDMTRMVDVIERKTVACPDCCDYIALSYVWGGIMPVDGALELKTLPRTIEDAITVTMKLGKRYLWVWTPVDALCINQSQTLNPEQAAAKQEQLNMMDLIYECASLTVIALEGNNSDCGLAGVSLEFPRYTQIDETIEGYHFFTLPPIVESERDLSVWNSRAWTLQESMLSKRKLYLSVNQASFECVVSICEEHDTDTIFPGLSFDSPQLPSQLRLDGIHKRKEPQRGSEAIPQAMTLFGLTLGDYTSRRMTNEDDSINAFLGILSFFEKRMFLAGFIYGLPLRSHPETLGWLHDEKYVPKRRKAFPSWSWAGWEGATLFSEILTSQKNLREPRTDLTVEFVAVNGKEIVIEGWMVTLDVRTEPLSEALKPGSEEVIGFISERNFSHNNTLPSGTYSCLVVQRVKVLRGSREKQQVVFVVLDWTGQVASRKTLVTLNLFLGVDFMDAKPVRGSIRLI